jgi:hypothetical protein
LTAVTHVPGVPIYLSHSVWLTLHFAPDDSAPVQTDRLSPECVCVFRYLQPNEATPAEHSCIVLRVGTCRLPA